ncbi:hypothetical protein K432DRAFT_406851 [Lepidopterella palustris CBS 459.81]|uniref:Uncharacterized protein n=1 Tax=Lepidopterella palustris CBS 459.81 TaxID=1314670 RepID=A0A8E2E5V7_9PEZI|nr:hypothetical protein K432DRAFT_406851 [Lepidopterella palustris CBS 459.81]
MIHELSNTITSYSVAYPSTGGFSFTQVGNQSIPSGTAAADIAVSPDNRYFISSSRNSTLFPFPNPIPSNTNTLLSDSLSVWKPTSNGTLLFQSIAPGRGSFPWHLVLITGGYGGSWHAYEWNGRGL